MWEADAGMREYRAFMKEWAPNEEVEDSVFPYATAQIIVEILKNCGDDLSRENLIRQRRSTAAVPARPDDQRHPNEPDCLEKGQDGAFRRHQMGVAR